MCSHFGFATRFVFGLGAVARIFIALANSLGVTFELVALGISFVARLALRFARLGRFGAIARLAGTLLCEGHA